MMAVGAMTSALAPPSAEEIELQNKVTKALESQGVLNKIKAQLRAAVFQSIHGVSNTGNLATRPSQPVLPSVAKLSSFGAEGDVALALVWDLLEKLELEHTLTVFLAEANLEKAVGEPSGYKNTTKLCERVGVSVTDADTPVLVKLVRNRGHVQSTASRVSEKPPAELEYVHSTTRDAPAVTLKQDVPRASSLPRMELPPPPASKPATVLNEPTLDMEDSMAEEVASGSFVEESLAEESMSSSNRDDRSIQKTVSVDTKAPPRRDQYDDEDNGASPAIASPPPVPTKLGSLPQLPGIGRQAVDHIDSRAQEDSGDENDRGDRNDEEEEEEKEEEDEDLDEDAAAARLHALEEKLQEMEAEDDTGVLQQLKGASVSVGEDTSEINGKRPISKPDDGDDNDEGEGDEDNDNYGDDFEEEVEEEEEDEVASEMSEDVASISALSESEVLAPPRPKGTENDKAVDSEDALNSYDYIEPVERD